MIRSRRPVVLALFACTASVGCDAVHGNAPTAIAASGAGAGAPASIVAGGAAGVARGAAGPGGGSGTPPSAAPAVAGSQGSQATGAAAGTGGAAGAAQRRPGAAGIAGVAGAAGAAAGMLAAGGGGALAGSGGSALTGAAGSAGTAGSGTGKYNPCPSATGEACAVLPLGDSITEGCCQAPFGGYRIPLFRRAVLDHKHLTFVGSLSNGPATVEGKPFPQHHEGHGGYTIDSGSGHSGISGKITDTVLASDHPAIVLLMIGTNDINGNIDIGNAPTRLGALMDDITARAPNALLVVSSIIPTRNDGTNQRVQAYNAALRDLVDKRAQGDRHVVFVDNYAAFSSNKNYKTELMGDNLHPNDAGYGVLGASFYERISELLPIAQ